MYVHAHAYTQHIRAHIVLHTETHTHTYKYTPMHIHPHLPVLKCKHAYTSHGENETCPRRLVCLASLSSLRVLFREITECLGHEGWLEESLPLGAALRVHSFAPLSLPSVCTHGRCSLSASCSSHLPPCLPNMVDFPSGTANQNTLFHMLFYHSNGNY